MHRTRIHLMAAMLAVSNLGMGRPEQKKVDDAIEMATAPRSLWNLSSAVNHFAQQHMESEEHEAMFLAEAESWVGYLNNNIDKAYWPWVMTASMEA